MGIYTCCKKTKKDFNPLLGRNGCKKRYHQVDDEIIRNYYEYTGIIRDIDNESDIGPVWRENPKNGTVYITWGYIYIFIQSLRFYGKRGNHFDGIKITFGMPKDASFV